MAEETRKCALVTGGGQGIGRAVARRLLEDGWAVAIAELDREAGKETEAEFASLGPCIFQPTDVRVEEDVKNALAAALLHFGRLDGLVNN
ncbi:MAG: SDR family oxidoreductase, partial [Pseudomonadota bacterium]